MGEGAGGAAGQVLSKQARADSLCLLDWMTLGPLGQIQSSVGCQSVVRLQSPWVRGRGGGGRIMVPCQPVVKCRFGFSTVILQVRLTFAPHCMQAILMMDGNGLHVCMFLAFRTHKAVHLVENARHVDSITASSSTHSHGRDRLRFVPMSAIGVQGSNCGERASAREVTRVEHQPRRSQGIGERRAFCLTRCPTDASQNRTSYCNAQKDQPTGSCMFLQNVLQIHVEQRYSVHCMGIGAASQQHCKASLADHLEQPFGTTLDL